MSHPLPLPPALARHHARPATPTNKPTTGHATRPAAVLFHCSAGSARQWDALAEDLRGDFAVHAIDLHGHGARAPWRDDRPLSVHDEAAFALPVIERAGGAHLIGHSYGAAIALHLAAARPELVRSVALFEPVVFSLLVDHEPQGNAACEAVDVAQALRHQVAAGQAHAAAERWVGYWSGASAWHRLGPQRQAAVASKMTAVVMHYDALDAARLPLAPLQRLKVPMLFLTGSRSPAAAQRIGSLLRALLPDAQHQALDGLGHMAPVTDAAVINERLLCFLAPLSHSGRPRANARP